MKTFRNLSLWLLFVLSLCAQTRIVSTATITGISVATAVDTTEVARWVQFVAPATNTGTVRIGNSTVSATRGLPLAAGAGFMLPVLPSGQPGYSLAQVFYFVPTGNTLDIMWAK